MHSPTKDLRLWFTKYPIHISSNFGLPMITIVIAKCIRDIKGNGVWSAVSLYLMKCLFVLCDLLPMAVADRSFVGLISILIAKVSTVCERGTKRERCFVSIT